MQAQIQYYAGTCTNVHQRVISHSQTKTKTTFQHMPPYGAVRATLLTTYEQPIKNLPTNSTVPIQHCIVLSPEKQPQHTSPLGCSNEVRPHDGIHHSLNLRGNWRLVSSSISVFCLQSSLPAGNCCHLAVGRAVHANIFSLFLQPVVHHFPCLCKEDVVHLSLSFQQLDGVGMDTALSQVECFIIDVFLCTTEYKARHDCVKSFHPQGACMWIKKSQSSSHSFISYQVTY